MSAFARALTLAGLLTAVAVGSLSAQSEERLRKRWVGTLHGRALHLEFYGDSMLIVNDEYALDYRTTGDSIVAWGDSSLAVSYRLAVGRLLLFTEDGEVVTMSEQDALARPLEGRWVGAPSRWTDQRIELVMSRGGTARWRRAPDGGWVQGEWDRVTRLLTFTWLPDSTMWSGQYDPAGNAVLFEEGPADGGTVVLRRVFR